MANMTGGSQHLADRIGLAAVIGKHGNVHGIAEAEDVNETMWRNLTNYRWDETPCVVS
jgi:hypothetical protein